MSETRTESIPVIEPAIEQASEITTTSEQEPITKISFLSLTLIILLGSFLGLGILCFLDPTPSLQHIQHEENIAHSGKNMGVVFNGYSLHNIYNGDIHIIHEDKTVARLSDENLILGYKEIKHDDKKTLVKLDYIQSTIPSDMSLYYHRERVIPDNYSFHQDYALIDNKDMKNLGEALYKMNDSINIFDEARLTNGLPLESKDQKDDLQELKKMID